MISLKTLKPETLLLVWVACLTAVVVAVAAIANFGLGVNLIRTEMAEHFNPGVPLDGGRIAPPSPPAAAAAPNLRNLESAYNRVARTLTLVTVGIAGPDPKNPTADRAVGSGIVVSGQHVLTNLHVVTSADTPRVVTYGPARASYPAVLVKSDPANDLAVLKIQSEKTFPFARIGNSDPVDTGDIVFSVGNSLGFGNTVTAGIISNARRSFTANGLLFRDMFQTDTGIHPGSSGGPLASISGDVIGVNTAIYAPGGGFTGIGFATPINRAIPLLRETGLLTIPEVTPAAGCFVPNTPACTLAAGSAPAAVPPVPAGPDVPATAVRCPGCGTYQSVRQDLRCPTCSKRMVIDPSGTSFACPAGHVSGAVMRILCTACGTSYTVNPYSLAA